MSRHYTPICATPHPPFDVSAHVGAATVATTAVIVHLLRLSPAVGVMIVALAVVLAALLRRRWRHLVSAEPHRDLYPVLFLPMWGTAALVLSVIVAAAVLESHEEPAAWGFAPFFAIGAFLPSMLAASWFANAAARGGPAPPASQQRELLRAGVWRTTAVMLWPIQFFGMFDSIRCATAGSATSVAAALTLACWVVVVLVALVHLAARRRMRRPPGGERDAPEARAEEPYRKAGVRPHPTPAQSEEPGLRTALTRELRGDLFAWIAISVPLVGHVLIIT